MARHHLILVGLVAGFGLVAAACSDDPSVDGASLVDGLPAAVVPEAPDVVTDVTCPDPETGAVAQTLVCEAVLNGRSITVDLAVDEEGQVAATVREPLLDLTEVEQTAAARLVTDLGVEVDVRCPGTVVVAEAGVEVACTGTSNERTADLVVRVLDGGDWTIAFAE